MAGSHTYCRKAAQSSRLATILLVAGVSGFALASAYRSPVSFDAVAADHSAHLMEEAPSDTTAPDPKQQQQHQDSDLPQYRLSEIRKHDANSDTPWVIHGNKVYDITDWIPGHPGGQVILRAAGGSIEPYWDIFTIHKSDYVYEILSQYQIGYVHPADLVDGKPAQDAIEDPFANDPIRDPSFTVHTAKPRNAEPPEEALDEHFMTPNHLFYIRNHMWVPKVENGGDDHVLTIELPDGSNKEYTLKELKAKFPSHTVAAALQCSGNRRRHMSEGSGRKANGLPWTVGAISNATWEGVYLSDILNDAGFDVASARNGTSEAKHIHFGGLEAYSASIPIKKAVDPQGDVLLAYSMNGEPLPRDHGFPLRAIVPGHVAARSVKWLSQITLSDEESPSQWQRRDYKCFGPNQTQVDWDSAPAIQELPVQSAITSIKLGKATPPPNAQQSASSPEARTISVGGYAYSGGGRAIIRVDVSLDDGKTWDQAYLLPDCQAADGSPSPCLGNAHWTWKRWRYEGTLPASALQSQSSSDADAGKRCTQVVVKATDEVYNTQPETHAATWNVRGNLATAWHRVKVCADCKPTPTSKGVEKTASRE
ncbi:Oxidoreductase, molybdopterin-binding domain-containing protein [Stachybotrys elegans]|uniref:Nitrate reductase [NADPH] n=1 Tax=Stachybotrys elegans TaxID=80388 RepID=A0A8K0WU51_9HYPO|nr:Oxidoreductase, molybdopterin-binding domain-containing protein [Stachybotrys elegans]